jgi:hypothetical protein
MNRWSIPESIERNEGNKELEVQDSSSKNENGQKETSEEVKEDILIGNIKKNRAERLKLEEETSILDSQIQKLKAEAKTVEDWKNITQNLRILGDLYKKTQKLEKEGEEFEEIGIKKMKNLLEKKDIESAFGLAELLDLSRNENKEPSMSSEIKQLGKEKVIDCLKRGDINQASRIANFLKVFEDPEIQQIGLKKAIDCLGAGDGKSFFEIIQKFKISVDSPEIKKAGTEKAVDYFDINGDSVAAERIIKELNLSLDLSKRQELGFTPFERAERIMRDGFFGPEKIKEVFGVHLEKIPEIPYSPKTLKEARERGGVLILRIESDQKGDPLTIENMKKSRKIEIKSDKDIDLSQEPFFTKEHPRTEWKIVAEDYICARGKNFFYGTLEMYRYLQSLGVLTEKEKQEFPSDQDIIRYFDDQINKQIVFNWREGNGYTKDSNWKGISKQLEKMEINQHRRSLVEYIYDRTMGVEKGGPPINIKKFELSRTLSSDGRFMSIQDNYGNNFTVGSTLNPGAGSIIHGIIVQY